VFGLFEAAAAHCLRSGERAALVAEQLARETAPATSSSPTTASSAGGCSDESSSRGRPSVPVSPLISTAVSLPRRLRQLCAARLGRLKNGSAPRTLMRHSSAGADPAERLAEEHLQVGEIDRLGEEVIRAALHRLDRHGQSPEPVITTIAIPGFWRAGPRSTDAVAGQAEVEENGVNESLVIAAFVPRATRPRARRIPSATDSASSRTKSSSSTSNSFAHAPPSPPKRNYRQHHFRCIPARKRCW
jgi:hypothetical protein